MALRGRVSTVQGQQITTKYESNHCTADRFNKQQTSTPALQYGIIFQEDQLTQLVTCWLPWTLHYGKIIYLSPLKQKLRFTIFFLIYEHDHIISTAILRLSEYFIHHCCFSCNIILYKEIIFQLNCRQFIKTHSFCDPSVHQSTGYVEGHNDLLSLITAVVQKKIY